MRGLAPLYTPSCFAMRGLAPSFTPSRPSELCHHARQLARLLHLRNLSFRRLDAHRAHQATELPRRHSGHLGRDPATEAQADEENSLGFVLSLGARSWSHPWRGAGF